jgi:hypothetical protein
MSDGDIEALATELKRQFYLNLGKGVAALMWKGVVIASVAVAVYGSLKGFK